MENWKLLARYFVTNVFDVYNLSRKVTTSEACGKRGLDQQKKEGRFHKNKDEYYGKWWELFCQISLFTKCYTRVIPFLLLYVNDNKE